jgi:hypothetical protein
MCIKNCAIKPVSVEFNLCGWVALEIKEMSQRSAHLMAGD